MLFLNVVFITPDKFNPDCSTAFLQFKEILSAIYFLEEMDNSMRNKRMIYVEFRKPKPILTTANRRESNGTGTEQDHRRGGREDNRGGRRGNNNSPRTAEIQREYHIQRSE
jgi:hypothetical protein